MSRNSSSQSLERGRIADSPWFWVALFLAAALVALVVIGPKYARRQRIIENKYRADQQRTEQPVSPPHEPANGQTTGDTSTEPELLIPIEPLVALIAVLFAAALAALYWSRWRSTHNQHHHEAAP